VSFSVSVALLEEDKEIEEREKRRRKGGEKEKGEKMDFFSNLEISVEKNKRQFMKLILKLFFKKIGLITIK
jgi:hypothetical protein